MKAKNMFTVFLSALVLTSVACVLVTPGRAQEPIPQEIESIAAVVGKEAILKSELEEQVLFYCMQAQIEPTDTARIREVTEDILDRMIDAKVIVNTARAQKLTVSKEELDRAVNDALTEVKTRLGSEEKYKEELAKEGLTEGDLRARYQKDLESQLLATKLVDKEIRSKVTATDKEVEQFYNDRKGELPKKPPETTLAQIVIMADVDSSIEVTARARGMEVLKAIRDGQEFERLAAQYSDDPSAERGGDVGTFKKGEFEEEFERVAFSLEPGQISNLVKSRFGYHIIKMVEKTTDEAHVKHILIKFTPSDEAEQKARSLATDLRKRIEAGESFGELAKKYSDDTESAVKDGVVGSYVADGLAAPVRAAIKGLPEGGVSDVTPLDIGYHIFKIVSKAPEREYKFDEVKDRLRQLVVQEKSQNAYERWVAELRTQTYIEKK